MNDPRITVRGDGLRDAVQKERDRLREIEGLDLSVAQTAARLIRIGLAHGAPLTPSKSS